MNTQALNQLCLFFSVILLLLTTSCFQKPDFEFAPKIEFNDLRRISTDGAFDSLFIVIDFEDGDGDLGIFQSERNANFTPPQPPSPFQEFFYPVNEDGEIEDTVRNAFHFNYFVTVLRQEGEGESFLPIDFGNGAPLNNGGFPPLFEEEPDGPLEGTLNHFFTVRRGEIYQNNDLIKFQIQIADRAFNLSNIIETDTIRILPSN